MAEPVAGLSLERIVPPSGSLSTTTQAKVALSTMAKIERHRSWPILARLPMRFGVSAIVPHFRVRNLLALKPGETLETVWPTTEDVPLTVGGVLVFWAEFEVVEERLAVRLTRLP